MAEMTDSQFRQKVIDVLQEVGMVIGDNIDVVTDVDDKITLPGVQVDDNDNPIRYVAAKMSVFMKPATDAAAYAKAKGDEAEAKGNAVKEKGDTAAQQGATAAEQGSRAQSIYETVNSWWTAFKVNAENFYNNTMNVTWQNWYNTFKQNAENWWASYPDAIEEWYSMIKPEIENWYDDIKEDWTNWFSDTKAGGVRKVWNDWWASVQSTWQGWTQAEANRVSAENVRIQNENLRISQENTRKDNETIRQQNEEVRLDGTWRQNLETGKWERYNQRTKQWEDTGNYWLGGLIAYRFYTDPKTGRIHVVKNNNDRVNFSLVNGKLKGSYVG